MYPKTHYAQIERGNESDHSKKNDHVYCVEWGIAKGEYISDLVIDRYINELKELIS